MAKRRILEVFNRYAFYGGEEKIADEILQQLARHHDVKSCRFDSRDWTGADAPSKLSQVGKVFYNVQSACELERAIDQFQPDVALFHNVYPVASPAMYRVAKRKRVPVMQYVHNFRPFSVGGSCFAQGQIYPQGLQGDPWPEVKVGAWQNSRLKSAIMALSLKRLIRSGDLDQVKAWICISDFMRNKFAQAGLDQSRLKTLLHATHVVKSLNTLSTADEPGTYLFLGRIVEEKGVRILVQAWNLLQQRLKDKTPRLHLAGEGPLRTELESISCDRVHWLGQISGSEKLQQLHACRAVIVPSIWWEPLGLVTYEAYQACKPVLAARSGGLEETVQDGITGLLHTAGDAQQLMQNILIMQSMQAQDRYAWGVAGFDWLQRHASWDVWQQKFDQIMEQTLQ